MPREVSHSIFAWTSEGDEMSAATAASARAVVLNMVTEMGVLC